MIRRTLVAHLSSLGHACSEAEDGLQCVDSAQTSGADCVVLDLRMPRMDGLTALRTLRARGNEVPVVVITANGGVDSAIEAVKLGAKSYLQKPVDVREVGLAVERALEDDRLQRQVAALSNAQRTRYGDLVGQSDAMRPLLEDLARLETVSPPTILVLGESGSGKDVVARAIHARGPRAQEVFVEVDCTALPDTLFESELFGHERGAFTDAKATKRGLLEVAAGGVVFLDEIGELTASAQAKLLRALESRTFKRVGGVTSLRLEATVIAATNRDLAAEVKAGRFREDLFYRLDVITLRLPPLRERRDDLPLLVNHFLRRFNESFGRAIEGVDPDAMARMLAYGWPGNVRELRNVLERIAILGDHRTVTVDDLPAPIRFATQGTPRAHRGRFELPADGIDLAEVERDFVLQALDRTGGKRAEAAKLLGLSRFQLRSRIAKFGL
ncbi:MAG: sigma-54-dependent Fis family transcriptional regulator [Myxococcales bacterium]|nr:sigma-54-dependent Fis family transcriptional regulator [Myxococcales bacterium]